MKKLLILLGTLCILFFISVVFLEFLDLTSYNNAPVDSTMILDSKENLILLYREDSKDQGESNILKYIKISPDNKVIEEKTIINTASAFYKSTIYTNENDDIGILWYNMTNSTFLMGGFAAGWHPYKGDLIFRKIDSFGNYVSDRILFENITEYEFRKKDISISKIDSTMKQYEVAQPLIDAKRNKHFLNQTGGHFSNAKLTYYVEKEGKLVELKIAEHGKNLLSFLIGGYCPTILGNMILIDSDSNVHITWSINNGLNKYYVFYVKLDENGKIINKIRIG